MKRNEIYKLAANVDRRASIPRGFGLWSETMQVLWLKQHQKKLKGANVKIHPGLKQHQK